MYKVVGADRREYGPVSRETILEWIAQGRANSQTIARFETGAWKPLGTFDEFKAALGVAGTPDATMPLPATGTQVTSTSPAPEPLPFSGVASQRKTNVPSVLGLIIPIVCCCCAYVGPLAGIVLSLVGLSQIRANPQKYSTSEALPKIGLGVSIAILLFHILAQLLDSKLAKYLPKMPTNF